MQKLAPNDLLSLEQYAEQRAEFRQKAVAHKNARRLQIGPTATLYFEDRLTMHYQIQEVLRVEKIFERPAIEEELEAYNPLIPDGANLKATFMLEFEERAERLEHLSQLVGIEDTVWARVGEYDKVYAIADEDMERDTEEKTSAVHFLRFEFNAEMVKDAKDGASFGIGIDFDAYRHVVEPLPGALRDFLAADFD